MKITTKKEKTDRSEFLKALKAIPGVMVDEDGKITYNGREVKSISINGRAYSVDPE